MQNKTSNRLLVCLIGSYFSCISCSTYATNESTESKAGKVKVFLMNDKTAVAKSVVPDLLEQAILSHEGKFPTKYTVSSEQLKHCNFLGTRIELDDILKTEEWVVTTKQPCNWEFHPKEGEHSSRTTIWIAQRLNNEKEYKVLISKRGKTVFIKPSKSEDYKNVTFRIKSNLYLSGMTWKYINGKYKINESSTLDTSTGDFDPRSEYYNKKSGYTETH